MSRLGLPFLFLLLTICWVNPLEAAAEPAKENSADLYRLPKTTRPVEYNIKLEPDLENFTFTGESVITFQVLEATGVVYLHAKNLNITGEIILTPNDNKLPIVKGVVKVLPEWELLQINCSSKLTKDTQYTFNLKYVGELNDKNIGFYRSRYLDKDNNVKWIATTHFEPTQARLAFPCWDEPALKAKFTIKIVHSKNHKAVSNMPQDGEPKPSGEKLITSFKQTPLMSSYLVAFVVSDYIKIGDEKLGVWTKPSAENQARYALEVANKVIPALDNFTGLSYTKYMPKLDQISIKDFNAGAMENWGLVTYREKSLLFEENVTTTSAKQNIFTTIAHEFAHQWFGNLVSPEWWKYIWLNEGFATYFQYYICNKVEPDWQLMEYFVTNALQGRAFVTDASADTRPINHDVKTPTEINNLFDNIAYQKAGSVIRMMSHILGQDTFKKGLQEYLKSKEYQAANSEELLNSLQKAAGSTTWGGANFNVIMDNWLNKPGYPVVNVKVTNETITLTQERFTLYPSKDDTKWWVPITYGFGENAVYSNTTPSEWLNPTNDSLNIPRGNASVSVIINLQQTGYYRVNYDNRGWTLLRDHLVKNHTTIHQLNRAQLIDDALTMARAGRLDYSTALSLTMYLTKEIQYIPWTTVIRHVNFLESMMRTSKKYDTFKLYIQYILKGITKSVGYTVSPNETYTTKLLRPSILKWNCKADKVGCVQHAEQQFQTWLSNSTNNPLDADLKNPIICAGLRSVKGKFNDTLQKLADSTSDEEEKNNLFLLLGCSNSESDLKQFLTISAQGKSKVGMDVAVKAVVSDYPGGVDLALTVLDDEYENIKKLNDSESKIKSCTETLANAVTTEEQFGKLMAFLSQSDGKPELLQTVLQSGGKNIQWIKSNKDSVEKWLTLHKDDFNSANSVGMVASFLLVLSIFITRFY